MNRISRRLTLPLIAALLLVGTPMSALSQNSGRSRQVAASADSYNQGFNEGYRVGAEKGAKSLQTGKRRNPSDFKQINGGASGDQQFEQGFRDGFTQGYEDASSNASSSSVSTRWQGNGYPGYGGTPSNGPVVLSRGRGPADQPPPTVSGRQNGPTIGAYPSGPPVLQRPNSQGYGYPNGNRYPGVGGYGRGRQYGNVAAYPGAGRIGYNTSLVIETTTPLSSKYSHEGEHFSAIVVSPGQLAGSRVEGIIGRIERPGRVAGNAEIFLIFQGIIFPDGYAEPMQAQVTDVIGYRGGSGGGPWGWNGSNTNGNNDVNAKAGDEGQIEAKSSHGRDIAIIGTSTAAGAVLGRVLGPGTWIGAAIGAAAGGGIVALNRGRDIELNPGTQLQILTGQGVRF